MNLEHKKRVISAVLGLFLLLGIYFGLGHIGVVLIALVISVASYFEFLSFSGSEASAKWLSLAAGAALAAWLGLELPGGIEATYLAALALVLHGLVRVHNGTPEGVAQESAGIVARVFGLLYLIVFPSFVSKVHGLPHGPALLFLMIGVVWLGDIGAYYGGKNFGKHKLSPLISPGKTWQGAIAGLLSCALWAVLWGGYALPHISAWKWVLICMLSSVVAQAGDLMESLLKRAYAVKDSGSLIPGHGGVFDRFDSLILMAPFFYLLLRLGT